MTVAAGIEIMPGGGSPKGLFQVPSGTHRSAWGESLAGRTSAGTSLAGGPASARAVWQSVLTSMGVSAPEQGSQEPVVDESLDSDLEPLQERAAGSDATVPSISGPVSSPGEATLPAVQSKSRQESTEQELAGHVGMQQRAGAALWIALETACPQKSALAKPSREMGNSKDPGVSDSGSAESTRKRKSSPVIEEAAAALPQSTPLPSALNPGQPIQQTVAFAESQWENAWPEKSTIATAQPESASGSQLPAAPGKNDLASAWTPSKLGAQNEDSKAPGASAGAEISPPRSSDDGAGGPAPLREKVSEDIKIAQPQGLKESANVPAVLKDRVAAGAEIPPAQDLSYRVDGPVPLRERATADPEISQPQGLKESANVPAVLKDRVAAGAEIPPAQDLSYRVDGPVPLRERATADPEISQPQGLKNSVTAPAVLKDESTAGRHAVAHQAVSAELQRHPVFPQIGAAMERDSKPVSEAPASVPLSPLKSPVETGTIPADSIRTFRVRGAQGISTATEAGNRNADPKSDATAKSRELNVSPRKPVQGSSIQLAAPASTAGDHPIHEDRVAAVVDEVAPAHAHGSAGATEASGQVIQSNGGPRSPGADPVVPAGTSGSPILTLASTEVPNATPGSGGRSGPDEAFSALDAVGANRLTWVHAGKQQAEAGFEDPRLGWVSVRADVSGGAIHAALVPATADAAQVMGGHLDGLNSYLSEHHAAVETITLAAPGGSAHESGEPGSQGQGMQQRDGSGQGSSQQQGLEAGSGFSENRQFSADSEEHGVSAISSATEAAQQDTLEQASSLGGRISVMA